MQPSTFLFGGACRRPWLKHAGARHNAFAASFAVNCCCCLLSSNSAVVDITAQHAV